MRIAMLTNNYKPFIAGVPISVERLAQGLRKIGHEVFVFAPSYENQVEEENVIRVKSRKAGQERHTIPTLFDMNIEKEFKRLNIDVIHVHHPMLLGSTGVSLGRKYNIPVVFTYHTRYEQYLHYIEAYKAIEDRRKVETSKNLIYLEDKVLSFIGETYVPNYLRNFANKCDMIFAPTNLIKECLEDNHVDTPIEIVPTGLDENYFLENVEEAKKIREKYINGKKYLFVTVARLVKEKNLEFLIDGLSKLKEKQGDNFTSLIIGEGKLKEELIQKAKGLGLEENIVFVGSVDNEKIGEYYRASDMFLFSSKSETQGIVLLEAMAARNPVVAIKATGVVDVVKNNINGFMTEDNVDDWSDKVAILLENDKLRKEVSQGAYDTSLKYLNSNIAKMAAGNYQKAIDEYCVRERFYTNFKVLLNYK